jgi:citrate lyase subunit beta/citryl-CoA lyase
VVRINADPRWLADDVRACAAAGIDFLMVPKVESSEQLRALEPMLEQMEEQTQRPPGSLRLLALIESPSGVLAAATLASASARVEALVFGAEDYAAALGIPAQAAALDWPAQQVAVAARAAGCAAWGLPGSMAGIADAASIGPLARRARAMGFTGCLCIHPAQLDPARAGFLPTAKEVAHARLVVAAAGSEKGAFVVEGRMVDAPVLAQAYATLQRAGVAAGSETSQTD